MIFVYSQQHQRTTPDFLRQPETPPVSRPRRLAYCEDVEKQYYRNLKYFAHKSRIIRYAVHRFPKQLKREKSYNHSIQFVLFNTTLLSKAIPHNYCRADAPSDFSRDRMTFSQAGYRLSWKKLYDMTEKPQAYTGKARRAVIARCCPNSTDVVLQ